jgi:hypothetical protein
MPACRDVEQARCALNALGDSGTCLTRSIAISTLLPGSEVVIGFHESGPSARSAHAWVEQEGKKVKREEKSSMFREIARLRSARL